MSDSSSGRVPQQVPPSPFDRVPGGRGVPSVGVLVVAATLLFGGASSARDDSDDFPELEPTDDSLEVDGTGPVLEFADAAGSFKLVGRFDDKALNLYSEEDGDVLFESSFEAPGKPTDIEVDPRDGAVLVSYEEGLVGVNRMVFDAAEQRYELREELRVPTGEAGVTSLVVLPAPLLFQALGDNRLVVVANPDTDTVSALVLRDGLLVRVAKKAFPDKKPHHLAQTTTQGSSPATLGRGSGRLSAGAAANDPRSIVGIAFDDSHEIGLYEVDAEGEMTPLGPLVAAGGRPRSLSFSEDGRFLFAALGVRTAQQPQLSDEIATYSVGDDGSLTLLGRTFAGKFLTDLAAVPGGLVAVTVSDGIKDEVRAYRRRGGELTLDASIEMPGAPGAPPSFKKVSVRRDCGAVERARVTVGEYQAGRVHFLSYTPSDPAPTPCARLAEDRFEVRVDWKVPSENRSGVGIASEITGDTGRFWFFDPANVELVVKVLDARVINGHFWVFYGALSDVEYTITVTDTQTGAVRRYFNPAGFQGSGADTEAFDDSVTGSAAMTSVTAHAMSRTVRVEPAQRAAGDGGGLATPGLHSMDIPVAQEHASSAACASTATALCLAQSRIEVRVDWSTATASGVGNAVPLSTDTGYFWFFDDANVELVVKVLDARVINGKFWVFYGALSDVEYTITVTDTESGARKTYSNPSGKLGSGSDTSAF